MADRRPDKLLVLLVDDDEDHLDLTSRLLKIEGFDVETSSTPIGVSNVVRRTRPDAVLLDVNIPTLSGPDLLRVLRKNVDASATKFVLHSSVDVDELRRLATDLGVDGFIPKGTAGTALARRLREICNTPR